MASNWSMRPKADRWAIIGTAIGAGIGVFAAAGTEFPVSAIILAVGGAIGFGAGRLAASLTDR